MCGIVGLVGTNESETIHKVQKMNLAQVHRGPDGGGQQIFAVGGKTLALGHRRLSILDLSDAGTQPMENPYTGDWIVYNGEIYNYPELKLELEQTGIEFRSRCDTEMILHAFARWGMDCFDRFRGMFAIVIFQRAQHRLIFARDSAGIKPLYYGTHGDSLFFSSEIRSIVAGKLLPLNIDRRAMAGLLAYGSVPEPLTIYQSIKMLPAGTYAVVDLNQQKFNLKTNEYCSFPEQKTYSSRSEAVALLRDRLESSARRHLLSDVPIGLFLSGGIDSTALAILCSKTSNAIQAFTVDFSDHPNIDENIIAARTARDLGITHHNVKLSAQAVRDNLGAYLNAIDQPSLDGLNTYIVSGAVREAGIKVAISGLGGDELFGGYNIFNDVARLTQLAPLMHWIPSNVRTKIVDTLFKNHNKWQQIKARELSVTKPTLRNLYFRRRRLLSDLEMGSLGFNATELDLNEDFMPPECYPDKYLDVFDKHNAISILESRFYMRNTLLRDSDVFSMAHGLEIRVPLLDRDLADAAYSMPGNWKKQRGPTNKPLLVDAMAPELDRILSQAPKRGFTLPQSQWMSDSLRDDFESHFDRLRKSGFVAPTAVTMIWQEFLANPVGAAWSRPWILGVLGAWLQRQAALQ